MKETLDRGHRFSKVRKKYDELMRFDSQVDDKIQSMGSHLRKIERMVVGRTGGGEAGAGGGNEGFGRKKTKNLNNMVGPYRSSKVIK